jgi:hypothetical protein
MNCSNLRLYNYTIKKTIVMVLNQLLRTRNTTARATHIKLINENTKIPFDAAPGDGVALGDWLLTARMMVWLTVGSRPVRENRVSHWKLAGDRKPSTSVAFPSKVTVYSGDKSKSRELI